MAKPLKILFFVIGSLLLLLVAAAIALPLLFDPNDYRSKIADEVKKQTGREFSVGDISLSVFPWVRVKLKDVTLGNAEGFGPAPMLTLQHAEVGAKLMPLLRDKRIEASTITLQGAEINLAVAADGHNNWQDLVKPVDPAAPSTAPPIAERLQKLDIEGITLDKVNVSYQDAASGAKYRVQDIQLKTGRLYQGKPFDVEGHFKAIGLAPVTSAVADFSAEVTLAGNDDVSLKQPSLKIDGSREAESPLAATLSLKGESLLYSQTAKTVVTSPMQLDIASLSVGPASKPLLTAKGSIKTQLNTDLAKQQHTLKGVDADLQLAGSALPGGKPQAFKLSANVQADLATSMLTLSQLQMAAFDLKASAAQWQLSQQGLAGDLAIASFEPRSLLTALGIAVPATADANVLKSASLNAQITASATSASLKNMVLKLDDTSLRGDVAVRDFASKAMSFALQADRLDADRYLPPPPKNTVANTATATASPAAKADANATALPIDTIDQLNAEGTLAVASMKLKNLKLANVRIKLDGAHGATHRQQLSAALYGGTAELNSSVAPGAHHALKLALSGISAGPLLKDFIDSDKLSGTGSFTLDVTSAGRTVGAVRQALDGKLAFNFVDGAVKGFNLGKMIRDGQALLSAQPPSATTGTGQATDFAELRGSGVITNGVLKSDQLTAKNPLLRLEGAGEVNLVNETINYLAKPTLVNTASGQGGKERTDVTGIMVPVRLTGSLYAPKVSIDWQAALKQQAVEQLRDKLGVSEETVREKREELRSKAKDEIGKGLLKLFGGKAAPPPAEPKP